VSRDAKFDFRIVVVSDSNYTSRAAALIRSAGIENQVNILALDNGVLAIREHFPRAEVTIWEEFLSRTPALRAAIDARSKAEQIFSSGPSFLQEQVESVVEGGWLIYCDADIIFYEKLESYFQSLPDCSVVITPHRHYIWNRRRLAKYGEFNVGLVAFKNDADGRKALEFWARSCIDWCLDSAVDGKYADQKYLEEFPSVSRRTYVENSPGANLAPWNAMFRKIVLGPSGEILVDGHRLTYFHAQGLQRRVYSWRLGHLNYLALASQRIKKIIYLPYIRELEEWSNKTGMGGFGSARSKPSFVARAKEALVGGLSVILGQTINASNSRKLGNRDSSQ
jgi:hypothetical protein